MKEKFIYTNSGNLVISYLFIIPGLLVWLMVLFSPFFLISILIFFFVYRKSRKEFFRIRITDKIVEAKNFMCSRQFLPKDFRSASIILGLNGTKYISLRTFLDHRITFYPKSKKDAKNAVIALEALGLAFTKNKFYNELIIKSDSSDGNWI